MGKGAGVIAYTNEGKVLIAYQNVNSWSFPKGHRIVDKKTGYKEPWIVTAEREFQEETKFPYHIELDEEMKANAGDIHLYFYQMSPEETELVYPDQKEILELRWIRIDKLDEFRKENPVNRTIRDLDIKKFKDKTGLITPASRPLNPYATVFVPSFATPAASISQGKRKRKSKKKSIRKRKSVKRSKSKNKKSKSKNKGKLKKM